MTDRPAAGHAGPPGADERRLRRPPGDRLPGRRRGADDRRRRPPAGPLQRAAGRTPTCSGTCRAIRRYPYTGSAIYYWDIGPVREDPANPGSPIGTEPPPLRKPAEPQPAKTRTARRGPRRRAAARLRLLRRRDPEKRQLRRRALLRGELHRAVVTSVCSRASHGCLRADACHGQPRRSPRCRRISAIACSLSRKWTALHAGACGRPRVGQQVVDEDAGLGGQAEPLEGDLVDPRFRLAAADEGGVDHGLEDLVDRQHRAATAAPTRARCWSASPSAGPPPSAPASARSSAGSGASALEVELAEAVQLRPVAEQRLEPVGEPLEEVDLGDLARAPSRRAGSRRPPR